MNSPHPERQPLMPAADLLGEALTLYARHLPLLIAVATVTALAGNLLGLLVPSSTVLVALLWGLFVGAVVVGLQAPVWLLAVLARRGERATAATVLYGAAAFSPRFFTMGLILGMGAGGLVLMVIYVPTLSLPPLLVLIFLGVRFSLAGPVIVGEGGTTVQALMRSWWLVEGHWWRTFLIQLPVVALTLMLVIISENVTSRASNILVEAVTSAVALGASAPLIALVETALYEEYRSHKPPAIKPGTLE